jgi:hypothetical protein
MMTKNISASVSRFLDCLTLRKITLLGGLMILALGVLLYLGMIVPLRLDTEALLADQKFLQDQKGQLDLERARTVQTALKTTDLPLAINYLQDRFPAGGLQIEEILLTPAPVQQTGGMEEAGIRISLKGEGIAVLQALAEVQSSERFPFLVREMALRENGAQVQLSILMAD